MSIIWYGRIFVKKSCEMSKRSLMNISLSTSHIVANFGCSAQRMHKKEMVPDMQPVLKRDDNQQRLLAPMLCYSIYQI